MAWEVPITVDGQTYTARFESETEPTPSQIEYAKRMILDPARGQSTGEGFGANMAQGFGKGLTATFLTGPGAIGEALGADDNFFLREGRRIEGEIEGAAPVSIENQEKFVVKAGGAIGQAGSMIVTAPLGGTSLKAAGVLNRARQLAFMGGFQGAAAGEEEATRLGITDPARKAALILGYGAVEAVSEKIGGYGVETGLWRMMRGHRPEGKFLKRIITQGAVEGGEEVGAGVPQRGLSKFLAVENPENPGFTYEGQAIYDPADIGAIREEFALGAIAGSTITTVQGIYSQMTPQQRLDTTNVASLPEELRKKAYEALQRVNREEAEAVAAAGQVDESTAAAMRVAFDGKRANVLDQAQTESETEFAPGYQEREKAKLIHSSDAADTFFEDGQWVVQSGTDANGQAIFAPAPNAAELEKARQEYIKTGVLGEGMQELKISAPATATPPAATAPPVTAAPPERETRHRVFEGGGPLRVAPGEGVLDARDPESAYRITGQPQIDDMVESGQVRAKEGKMRGGRSGETQWSRGDERLGYNAKANEGMYVVVTPHKDLNDRQGGVPLSEVSQIFRSDGKQWVDVTEQVKQQNAEKQKAAQPPSAPAVVASPPDEPPKTYKQQEQDRVRKAYPQSPELVEGIENAIGDAGTKAFLDKAEPKAKLLEELSPLTTDQAEERMRNEGVDEASITRITRTGTFEPRTAANAIIRARENKPSTGEPLHVKEAKEKMAQLPQETVDIVKRGASQVLSVAQISKTYEIPEEDVQAVFTALRVPKARREGSTEVTDEYISWLASNFPEQAKEIRAKQKAAKRKKEGPRVARASTKLDDVMRSREFKERTAGDFIDKLEEASGTQGFGGPKLIQKREGGKITGLMLDPDQQGEWDWYRPLLEDPELRKFIDENFLTGGQSIADASNAMDKMPEHDVGEALVEAARARLMLAKDLAAGLSVEAQEDAAEAEGRQAEEFAKATAEPTGQSSQQVTSWDLVPGDSVTIKGEPFAVRGTVLEYDEDTGKAKVQTAEGTITMRMERAKPGDVILQDGARFGRQILSTGEAIWVEQHERSGEPATDETTEAPPAPPAAPATSRQQAAEFESRIRELIDDEDIDGITNADIEKAVIYHTEGGPADFSPETAAVVARVEKEMQSPAERRAEATEQAQAAQAEIAQAQDETQSEKATTPPMLEWANKVVMEGNVNAGLNPRLLAAHSVRAAYWIMQNGNNFAKWSGQMVKSFGKGITEHLAAIWNLARATMYGEGEVRGPGDIDVDAAPESRVVPLTRADIEFRGRNVFGRKLWEDAQGIKDELDDKGDRSITFVRTAEGFENAPELVEGAPATRLEDGTIVVVTDQVRVTLEDIRAARANETTATEEAIRRVIRQERREEGEQNIRREARRHARTVLRDIQSAPQFRTLTNALWESDAFLELDALTGGIDNPTQQQKEQAVEIWLDDHFVEPIASVLSGDSSLNESMLPPGFSRAARNLEQLVKDALVYPYLVPKARIRFSARDPMARRKDRPGSPEMAELHARFLALDNAVKDIRQADAARIRAINGEDLLSDIYDPAAKAWGLQKLEQYARLTENGALQNRHLTEQFTIDYLPIYTRRGNENPRLYREVLSRIRGEVRKITGDNVEKYGYHDPSHEPNPRDILRQDIDRSIKEHAEAQERALQSEPGTTGDSSQAVARASAQGTPAPAPNRGVRGTDVQAAINGLRGILPNVDNTWVGTRTELQDYLRHNAAFRKAWIEDFTLRNGQTGITPDAAFDDFINFGLEGMEALTFDGRTYLMSDQIDIKPERGGTGALSARWVLIHENTHEVADHILDRFPELKAQWYALRNRVNPAQLDALARSRWTWMKDWRNNPELHDRIVHEWMAERIAEIEERGQPEPDSLLGRLLQWLRDVFSAAMGTGKNLNPSDRALLDFIEAARSSYQQVLMAAARSGVRYSASDHDGNTTPARATAQIDEGPQTPVQVTPPPRRQPYNRWSQARRSEYESAQSNPNLPGDMFHFTQFLGQETNHERITQSVAPMLEMSNRRLGGVDGQLPEVNQETTDAAYRDARALHERKTFSRKYIKEFQLYYGTNDEGLLIHEGDAAVAVHQMNLMRYAVRLMAATGDTRLFTQMEPFANDVILSDFTTMSGAGRLLQIRSLASRSDVGIWTAIQMTNGARHEAAASDVGEEARDEVAKSISGEEVKSDIQLGMDTAAETDDAAAELQQNATEYEQAGYRERAIELLDEQARAWDAELDKTLRRLDEMAQLIKSMESKAASAARPSMQEDAKQFKTIEEAKAEFERLKAKAKDLLHKLTQQDESHESKEARRKRIGKHKTLTADAGAKALLERYKNRNKRTKRSKPAWRDTFDAQVKTPQPQAAFIAEVTSKGVTPEVAQRLYELAEDLNKQRAERFADQATKTTTTPGKKGVSASAFLNSIVRQILKTPLSQQRIKKPASPDKEGDNDVENAAGVGNPWNRDWVHQTFTNAFVEQGVPEERAKQMADKLASRFEDIMRRAQEKAATKAAKGMGMKEPTIQKIGQAIRSGAFDATNTNPVIAALAEAAGYKALTPADLQRLAQLDAEIQDSVPTLRAKAYTQITRILAKAMPRKKWSRVMEQLFINGALSSLGVMSLNWLHPAYTLPRMLATDLANLLQDAVFNKGKGGRAANLALMGEAFTSLWQARRGMLSDAHFSLKNDAYQLRMIELLSVEHSLYRELMEQVQLLKTGSAGQKAAAATKLLWLSSDWVRRILSTADQTWGGVIQQYVLRNEAMRHMVQNLGMTVEAAHAIVEQAVSEGERAEQNHKDAGNDAAEAALVGRDIMRESLRLGIVHLSQSEKAGDDLITTMEQTSLMELGNRRGEDSPWWDAPNALLESFKGAASAIRNKMDAMNVPFGRAFTGFVSVASNIMNRSMYFTPLGFARVWAKTHGTEAKRKKIYTETMATEAMVRARLNEAIVSSIALTVLAILRYKWDDEDEWFAITGTGPKNNVQREAWLKQGHKPGMIEFRDGKGNVMIALPYTRGGFDHLAPALTVMGALDDMELDGHRPRPKDFNWGWAYAQQMAGNQIKQAQFFGVRELVGAVPSSDKPHALAGWVGYTVNPWTPWGGLTKSVFKIFSGAQEQGSARSAFLSNVPVAQLVVAGATGEFVGPRYNFLGDQIGGQPDDMLEKMAERASYSGFPIYIALNPDSKDEDIYNFIVRKGVAPAMPIRSAMETKNGFLTDEQWADYVKARGQILKDRIRRQMPMIERATPADAESMMETISRDATRQAKAKLKLD